MRRRLLGLAALLAVLGLILPALWAAGEDKKDTSKDDEKGWMQLFNGKDLTGWKLPGKRDGDILEEIPKEEDGKVVAYLGKLKNGSEVPLWRVEDGILIGSGPHSHLFTEKDDYDNFHYRVEAMINDHGNSGQYFRTQFGPGFPKGYEAQINSTHGDPIRTGSLYPAFNSKLTPEEKKQIIVNKMLVPPNEWFTQEVMMDGNHIVIKVNGKTTVDFVDQNNTYMKGHFALQGHDPGTVVKFRKVEYKPIAEGGATTDPSLAYVAHRTPPTPPFVRGGSNVSSPPLRRGGWGVLLPLIAPESVSRQRDAGHGQRGFLRHSCPAPAPSGLCHAVARQPSAASPSTGDHGPARPRPGPPCSCPARTGAYQPLERQHADPLAGDPGPRSGNCADTAPRPGCGHRRRGHPHRPLASEPASRSLRGRRRL